MLIFIIWAEVLIIKEVLGVYTPIFGDPEAVENNLGEEKSRTPLGLPVWYRLTNNAFTAGPKSFRGFQETLSKLSRNSRKLLKLFGPVKRGQKLEPYTITELFYSRILSMNRGSFVQEVSSAHTSPLLDTDELNKLLYGPVKFLGLSKNGPLVRNLYTTV